MNLSLLTCVGVAKCRCYIGLCTLVFLHNAHADDLMLYACMLVPCANATRNMLKVCDEFGERYWVIFNAIKFKCLLSLSSNRSCRLPHATTPVFYIGICE